MIKVTRIKASAAEYPCLMTREDGDVVLFVKKNHGLLLQRDHAKNLFYSDRWMMDEFTPFSDVITLKNE